MSFLLFMMNRRALEKGGKNMTRVFISQPMQGKTDEEIKQVRDMDIEFIKTVYPDAEIIDSFMPGNAPKDSRSGVYKLGQSIQLLAEADVLFCLKAGSRLEVAE